MELVSLPPREPAAIYDDDWDTYDEDDVLPNLASRVLPCTPAQKPRWADLKDDGEGSDTDSGTHTPSQSPTWQMPQLSQSSMGQVKTAVTTAESSPCLSIKGRVGKEEVCGRGRTPLPTLPWEKNQKREVSPATAWELGIDGPLSHPPSNVIAWKGTMSVGWHGGNNDGFSLAHSLTDDGVVSYGMQWQEQQSSDGSHGFHGMGGEYSSHASMSGCAPLFDNFGASAAMSETSTNVPESPYQRSESERKDPCQYYVCHTTMPQANPQLLDELNFAIGSRWQEEDIALWSQDFDYVHSIEEKIFYSNCNGDTWFYESILGLLHGRVLDLITDYFGARIIQKMMYVSSDAATSGLKHFIVEEILKAENITDLVLSPVAGHVLLRIAKSRSLPIYLRAQLASSILLSEDRMRYTYVPTDKSSACPSAPFLIQALLENHVEFHDSIAGWLLTEYKTRPGVILNGMNASMMVEPMLRLSPRNEMVRQIGYLYFDWRPYVQVKEVGRHGKIKLTANYSFHNFVQHRMLKDFDLTCF